MVHLRTRTLVRILSYLLFASVVLSGFVYTEHCKKKTSEKLLEDINRRTFSEFLSDLDGLDSSLSKLSLCSSSKQIALLSADVWNKANSAASLLSLLPLRTDAVQNTLSYLNKVASYAYVLSSSAEISDDVRSTLTSLCDCSGEVCASFSALGPYAQDEHFFSESTDSLSSLQPTDLSGSLQLLESAFPETPALIYDGPFSDHIKKAVPLVDKEALVTRKSAQQKAAALFDLSVDQVSDAGDAAGIIPTFGFTISGERNISVDITCHGGQLIYLSCDGDVSSSVLSENEAIEKGATFLKSAGYPGLEASYSYQSGGVLYINYEATQDGVICYPDLIQVGVSMSDGQVLFLNAEGYLANHCQRELSPVLTESDVLSSYNDRFTCQSVRLAVIPTDGKKELLTWELSCILSDSSCFLCYINAESGQEEKILFLQESENGTLVY